VVSEEADANTTIAVHDFTLARLWDVPERGANQPTSHETESLCSFAIWLRGVVLQVDVAEVAVLPHLKPNLSAWVWAEHQLWVALILHRQAAVPETWLSVAAFSENDCTHDRLRVLISHVVRNDEIVIDTIHETNMHKLFLNIGEDKQFC
jgi:hypothetical protein